MSDSSSYDLFFRFIETFAPAGFKSIDPEHRLVLQIESMMEENDQFFFIGDILHMKILFTSKRSINMIGIEPEILSPYHFKEATHPDDIQRHGLGNAKLFNMSHDLFVAREGNMLLSTNLRFRGSEGKYSNILIQGYLFYSEFPQKTVYYLQVNTNINWFRKIKHGFHYYTGNDLSYFRYPDEEMLMKGNILSEREFEIVKSIRKGMSSEQIASKLFLSKYTVNTHRNNILKKTGKSNISELIYELEQLGIL
jgi:DNA-binding CsgD family transcriptional regulator